MDLGTFEQAVKKINFSADHPSVSQRWENFTDHRNAFTADCAPVEPNRLLAPKKYQAVFWKEDGKQIELVRFPQRGIGRVLKRFDIP